MSDRDEPIDRARPYSISLLPGLLALAMGVAISSLGLEDDALSQFYRSLPEFELWRGVMFVQFTVYVGVAAYLVDASGDALLKGALGSKERVFIAIMTVAAIALPNVMVQIATFPLPSQPARILLIVASALVAMVLLTNRLARIHSALGKARDPETYRQLRQATQDLLIIAAATVTMGTLGTGILQASLEATAMGAPLEEPPLEYASLFNYGHVLAFGAYFTLLLLIFFAPIFAAERAAATRLRAVIGNGETTRGEGSVGEGGAGEGGAVPPDLNLEVSLVQRLTAAIGVLAPLLGAIASQLAR